MRRFAGWLCGLLMTGAMAADDIPLVMQAPDMTLKLYVGECRHPAVKEVLDARSKFRDFKHAEGEFSYHDGQKRLLQGCWRFFPDNDPPIYGMLWEDGDMFGLPVEMFQRNGL